MGRTGSDIHESIKLTNGLYWESSAYRCQRKHPVGTRRLVLCLVYCLVSLVDSLQQHGVAERVMSFKSIPFF